ncbi:type II toxin-antitoxin system PemK/MazF family toxin [uncultured Leifsonia sp.]|uniref:type II toxin-antitoxin system PemK/MazF family toxin n=1 Tax=uncultured Leifsonia sp. TaxID=340359 RepID=UPI0028D6BA1D|nr:type II toxin-antitoxin system PemK/MazF family toxin [uncultured Leifsonia sp.]
MASRILSALSRLFAPKARPPERTDAELSPGRSGAAATVQVDPRGLGRIRTSYNPSTDGDADPGEIVWTWVPYEEADGRGKDRPVLVVAAEPSGSVLAVALTSQEHPGRPDYLPIGSGDWDGRHRPSFVRIDRVFRVQQAGMRREAAALDRSRFLAVRDALNARYGWR